jgi:hypothetical protein
VLVLAGEVPTILPAEVATYEDSSIDGSYNAESNTFWYSLTALFAVSVIVMAIKH